MPLYEYQCEACGHRVEVIQRVSEPPLEECPECSGKLQRLLSAPAFQFKGSGWYVTDYAGKGKSGGDETKAKGDDAKPKDDKKPKETKTPGAAAGDAATAASGAKS